MSCTKQIAAARTPSGVSREVQLVGEATAPQRGRRVGDPAPHEKTKT